MRVYTIGHSTRSFDELVEALRSFGVRTLVDIRTVPRSRHVPQFNADSLRRRLPNRRIRYRHLKALGGLRKPSRDSTNTAWRNAGFRGFADYMETPEFAEALAALRALSRDAGPVAIMCAEAVPWRCHRSLVADALLARGDEVVNIMNAGKGTPHALTPWARVDAKRVTYPGPPPAPGKRASRGAIGRQGDLYTTTKADAT
ncbi:MAG TPA: DUF488 domain-containing protein [bacterium]|nr:DUF488 domain-containing protein [bacterium]